MVIVLFIEDLIGYEEKERLLKEIYKKELEGEYKNATNK